MDRNLHAPEESRLLEELVRTLVPVRPVLADETRAAVLRDVVGFVAFEVRSLPAHLRMPYRIALLGFDWLAVLRHGRRFVALDEARRSTYLANWSGGRLSLARDFVKLLRSCALLQYYDHALVRSALGSERGGDAHDGASAGSPVGLAAVPSPGHTPS